MNSTVAAVVVTFNRSRLLLECLEALLGQTRRIDKIIIVDNASSDDTQAVLASHGYLAHPDINYVRLPHNTGGAGGFHEGVKRGYEAGFDWLWLMDDDAEPLADALAEMQQLFDTPSIAGVANLTVSAQGEPQLDHRGWINLRGLTQRAHRPIDASALPERMEISYASFVGLAVPRTAVEQIGFPKREFFIHCDDVEYCLRLSTLGPILLARRSIILHKDAANAAAPKTVVWGRASARIPINRLWLTYYGFRNLIWLRRRHCGRGAAALFALRQYVRNAVGIFLYDSYRVMRLTFYLHAIIDGWRGVFDNEKPKRLTRV